MTRRTNGLTSGINWGGGGLSRTFVVSVLDMSPTLGPTRRGHHSTILVYPIADPRSYD